VANSLSEVKKIEEIETNKVVPLHPEILSLLRRNFQSSTAVLLINEVDVASCFG
jgi:hypothetical protein